MLVTEKGQEKEEKKPQEVIDYPKPQAFLDNNALEKRFKHQGRKKKKNGVITWSWNWQGGGEREKTIEKDKENSLRVEKDTHVSSQVFATVVVV